MYTGIATTYHGLSGQARSQIILPPRNHNLLNYRNNKCREISWWSSGWDSMLPLMGARA